MWVKFIEAKADSGSIGGDVSAEFLVVADTGEDEVLVANSVNYAANVEAAKCLDYKQHDHSDIPAVSSSKRQILKQLKMWLLYRFQRIKQ